MKSLAELATIKDTMQNSVAIREGKEGVESTVKNHVLICGGTGCTSSKSVEIKKSNIKNTLVKRFISSLVRIFAPLL